MDQDHILSLSACNFNYICIVNSKVLEMDECTGDEASDYTKLKVLGKGQTFLYTYNVPSFPVFKVILQEIKFQHDGGHGNVHVFEALAGLAMNSREFEFQCHLSQRDSLQTLSWS